MKWSSTTFESALAGGVTGNVTLSGEAARIWEIVIKTVRRNIESERGDIA
jgi:hypothetical protein